MNHQYQKYTFHYVENKPDYECIFHDKLCVNLSLSKFFVIYPHTNSPNKIVMKDVRKKYFNQNSMICHKRRNWKEKKHLVIGMHIDDR